MVCFKIIIVEILEYRKFFYNDRYVDNEFDKIFLLVSCTIRLLFLLVVHIMMNGNLKKRFHLLVYI